MISLFRPLHFEQKEGVSTVVLWLCELFDQQYSFRVTLSQIEHALGESARVTYVLPPEQSAEDFVEGSFNWGNRSYSLYFERSLGYMQFSSPLQANMEALQGKLSSSTTVR